MYFPKAIKAKIPMLLDTTELGAMLRERPQFERSRHHLKISIFQNLQ